MLSPIRSQQLRSVIATVLAKANSYPFAPPAIKDDDLEFFVLDRGWCERAGVHDQVAMRGTRTMERIYFKTKDDGTVFEQARFVETILDARNSYRANRAASPVSPVNFQRAASDLTDQQYPRDSYTIGPIMMY